MEQENFSELFNKFSQMMENGEIPDNIKNILNNNSSSSEQVSSTVSDNNSNNQNSFNMDFETVMKIQQIMNSLKNEKNDSRTNLLLSLKPYLKENRQQRVDQYINLFKMTKVMDLLNKTGGENIK